MSGKVSGMVWELDIPHEHAWLLMSLADHAEQDGTSVHPGGGLTAWKTGFSVRHVKRLTADLLNKYDLLEVVDAGGGAKRAEYRIKIENFDGLKKKPPKTRGRPQKTHDTMVDKPVEKTHDAGVIGKEKLMTSDKKPMTSTPARVETSVVQETSSNTSSRDANASRGQEKKGTPNWFDVLCERFTQEGIPISEEDRQRIPGNLAKCFMKESATEQEMYRLIGRIVSRRLDGVVLSPQRALGDIRGIPKNGSAEHTQGAPTARSREVTMTEDQRAAYFASMPKRLRPEDLEEM